MVCEAIRGFGPDDCRESLLSHDIEDADARRTRARELRFQLRKMGRQAFGERLVLLHPVVDDLFQLGVLLDGGRCLQVVARDERPRLEQIEQVFARGAR